MISTIFHTIWSRKRRLLATTTAVVLGVAFLAATLVLGDTTKAGFADVFTTANAGTDVVVRDATRIGGSEDRQTGLVPDDQVAAIAALDGVESAVAEVSGIAQIVGSDGERIGGDGPPTMAGNWIDDPELGWLTLTDGRAPRPVADSQPFEVVIDEASAREGDLAIGDTTTVLTPDPTEVVVVGLARFGDGDSLGGATSVSFETATAQRLFTGTDDMVSSVLVHGAEGTTPEQLRASIGAELSDGLEVLTGAELTAEQQQDIDDAFLGMFRTMLLAFAGISIVVATFSIHNTFSILVAQRTRESALLRAIGASRRQVLTGVAAEALAVGVVATAVGFAAGLGIASGLRALMESSLDMPDAALVVSAGAVIASIIVGVGTTLVASLGPAVKASRVAPLAALRDVAVDRSGGSKVRAVVGVALLGLGLTWLVTATSAGDDALARAGIGALGALAGAVVLGPVVARPAAAVLGAFPAATRGITGRIARRNAMRNPRRTAASASALMVGTAVVALFTTFGASIKQSINDTVADNFAGDLVILPEGFSGAMLSPELPGALAELPEVSSAIGTAFAPALVGDDTVEVAATDVAALASVFDVNVSSGALEGFTDDDLAVSEKYAEDHGLTLGSVVPMSFADGTTSELTVAAIYADRMTFGDLFVTDTQLAGHVAQSSFTVVLVDLVDEVGSSGAAFEAAQDAVAGVTGRLGAPDPMDRAEYEESISSEVDGMLFFVYAMLGVAVLIALLGIGNTLSLSIHDRTRELGLLRAVGQDRSQMRSSVRWESVIIAVFGTAGGIGFGAFAGWALMRAMNTQEGFGSFALPVTPLAIVLALSAGAGILAAVRPARRAARTDILEAIAA